MLVCSSMQLKQIEGTWETTIPFYEDNISGEIVYRFTFNRKNSSGGKFTLVFGGQVSFAKFAVQVDGDWSISNGMLYVQPDMKTLKTEKDIFLSELDIEGMIRSGLYNFGEGGALIVELSGIVLKLQNGEKSMTFKRI